VATDKWQTITEYEITKGMSPLKQPLSQFKVSSCATFGTSNPSDKAIPNSIAWLTLHKENIQHLEDYCAEFLIHAADNEGLQAGIDEKLVTHLSQVCTIPVTYAGGGRNLQDLDRVKELSAGKVDLTIGSALDVFGGSGVRFEECVEWNRVHGS
jgi:phosphoribosylformimino-5-aminoimidazole carboxamide ribotide isomerase